MDKDISKIQKSFESASNSAPNDGWDNINKKLEENAFDKKIKESFSSHSQKAPLESFAFLMNELDNPVDLIVNNSFNQYIVSAPEEVWGKIDTQLETDKIWGEIEGKVEVKSQKWKSTLAAACIVVLVSLIPSLLKDSGQSQEFFGGSADIISLIQIKSQVSVKSSQTGVLTNEFIVVENSLNTELQKEEIKLGQNNAESAEKGNLDRLDLPRINLLANKSFQNVVPQFDLKKPQNNEKRLSFGVIAGINRTWVIDNETRASFESNSLIDSKLILGSMVGIQAQYNFGKRSSIALNYIFNATSRNKLGKYNKGVYEHKISELKLSQLSILYGMEYNLGKKSNGWSLLSRFGPYAGIIRSSSIKEGGIITSFNNDFKKMDYGLNFQIAPAFNIQNFVIETGFNYKVGLRNIFAGNGSISSDLNYTNNTDLGVYISVRYKLQ